MVSVCVSVCVCVYVRVFVCAWCVYRRPRWGPSMLPLEIMDALYLMLSRILKAHWQRVKHVVCLRGDDAIPK